ncbi:ribulose-phosphate 3-epimerase [Chloroflexota bacterium]
MPDLSYLKRQDVKSLLMLWFTLTSCRTIPTISTSPSIFTSWSIMSDSKVVPAILTDDPKAMELMLRQAETFTDWVQIDIMDGKFVPSRSISYEQLDGFPVKVDWEVHLMVKSPEDYVEGFCRAGAQKVVFHYESTSSPREVISLVRKLGLGVGLAVNPETPVCDILPLAGEVDSMLFLSVNPGFYGSKFIPGVLDKIMEFRNAKPGVEIGIDGGIKEDNIVQIARSGVDVIYVGSAIFLQPQPGESFRRLTALVEAGL